MLDPELCIDLRSTLEEKTDALRIKPHLTDRVALERRQLGFGWDCAHYPTLSCRSTSVTVTSAYRSRRSALNGGAWALPARPRPGSALPIANGMTWWKGERPLLGRSDGSSGGVIDDAGRTYCKGTGYSSSRGSGPNLLGPTVPGQRERVKAKMLIVADTQRNGCGPDCS